ncbi:hypothetical protein ACIQYG_18660 [Peribacillus sp. NPDC096622]|uniref:hypothetical protein n=1 Tax=Peribacillus sp. NPDC096622 TaxID=3364396 RepID=UPI003802A6EB
MKTVEEFVESLLTILTVTCWVGLTPPTRRFSIGPVDKIAINHPLFILNLMNLHPNWQLNIVSTTVFTKKRI